MFTGNEFARFSQFIRLSRERPLSLWHTFEFCMFLRRDPVALLAVSACKRDAPKMPAGLLTSPEARAAGSELFAANCAICHGTSGDGRGLRQGGMNPPPANLRLLAWPEETSGCRIYKVIHDGVPGTAMPPWPTLNDRQIWDLVAYIHSLRQ